MKPLRIAMVIARYPPEAGGAELQCLRLSTVLSAMGHEVVVLTEKRRASLPDEVVDQGVRVNRMVTHGMPPYSSLEFAVKLWRHLRAQPKYDILHAHLIAMPALFALFWGALTRIPVVVKTAGAGPTGDIASSLRLRRGRLKLALFKRSIRHVVAPSHRARQELLDIGVQSDKVHLIPNGVNFERFRPPSSSQRMKAKADVGIASNQRTAIYAGRWVEGKNVELLLDIWEQGIARSDFAWSLILLIAGNSVPPTQRARLEGLRPYVRMFHDVENVSPYYHAADIAILLSVGEGLSNFLLEAMACGLPTLTSESAAVSQSSARETWGWVIPDSLLNPPHVTTILVSDTLSPSSLTAKGTIARYQIEQDYSLTATAKAYERLYRSMQ